MRIPAAYGISGTERASKRIKTGNAGAGMGATVGKLLGFDKSMKSGVGYHELHGAGGLSVGAYVAVNACGEIFLHLEQKRGFE